MLAVGAGGGCLDIFSLAYHFSFLSPCLWETTRYRLKYCLKEPLSPKQPTNHALVSSLLKPTTKLLNFVTTEETERQKSMLKRGRSGGAMVLGKKLIVPRRPTYLEGWSGGAKVLGKLPVGGGGGWVVRRCWVNFQCRGVLLIWLIVGQGPTALAVDADGGCLDIFTLIYLFSPLSPPLWETVRYRLKYCLKGPLNPKQPTNQLPVPRRPTILDDSRALTVGQGPTALAVRAGSGCLDIFTLIYPFSPLSPSLWETARYVLKYCLKRPLNPEQPTNQPTYLFGQKVGQGASAIGVGAGGGCLDIFSLVYHFSLLSPSL